MSPDNGYAGDVGSDAESSTSRRSMGVPVYLQSRMSPDFIASCVEPTRYCIFNTGVITAPEAWDILKDRLAPEVLDGLVRVQAIRQPNGNPRVDLWVEARVAADFSRAMYMKAGQRRKGVRVDNQVPLCELQEYWKPNAATRQWRLDFWKPWRDVALERKDFKPPPEVRRKMCIATLNVNGYVGKRVELMNFLCWRKIGILAMQETLVDNNKYSLRVSGYQVYQRPKKAGFRGQALLVSTQFPSYEVSSSKESFYIHVKVTRVRGQKPWHVFAVYYPSGGNFRAARTKCLNTVLGEYKKVVDKDPAAVVIILGDHNIEREDLERRLKPVKTGLQCLPVSGSELTFHRKGSRWTSVDNIVVNSAAKGYLYNAKVLRDWSTGSDHFPLVAGLKPMGMAPKPPKAEIRRSFNVDLIKGHGNKLVFSNRWASLPVESVSNEDDLNEAVEKFTDVIIKQGLDSHLIQPKCARVFTHCRQLKKLLVRLDEFREKYNLALKRKDGTQEACKRSYLEAQKTARAAIRQREAEMRKKEVKRVAELYRKNEMKAFHRWEKNVTVGNVSNSIGPVLARDGTLVSDPPRVVDEVFSYYKALNQDDPEGLSRNKEYWVGKAFQVREESLPGLDDLFTWKNVLLAIRHMATGTAPGCDGIPVEVYKSLLKEECHAHLKAKHAVKVGDATYVALPEGKLPETPMTPMGVHLWRIVEGIWKLKKQPEAWSKVVNVSMYKAGDAADLKNYRALSLIVVGMKIVTTVMALGLSRALESNNVLVKEQAGFRPREEAIAQFITFAEMVRRRRIKGLRTYAIFVDFEKAFDKVMQEALFEKLRAEGVKGEFLDLLMAIYQTSKATVRVNGNVSDETYDMTRGTRQGCPMSPPVFSVQVNDFKRFVPPGIEVPGLVGANCPDLQFADDIVGLADSEEGVEAFLKGVTEFSRHWHQPVNAKKCAVMLFGDCEEEQLVFAKRAFEVDGKVVQTARKYKYLGIQVTDKLGDKEQTDELAHCKTLAHKVKVAVDMRRAFLRDKAYPVELKLAVIKSKIMPVGTYGGEWLGLCQKRTNIIQSAVNVALRLVLQSSTKSNLHGVKVMCWELGLPSVEEAMASLRVRLYHKAPTLKTWLKDLVAPENKFKDRSRVWSSQTAHSLSAMRKTGLPVDSGWIWETLLAEGRVSKHLVNLSDDASLASKQAAERQNVKMWINGRAFAADATRGHKVGATATYVEAGYGYNRKWLKSAAMHPALVEGTIWLIRVRTSAWWTTRRRYDVLRKKDMDFSHLSRNTCPCCGDELEDDEDEIEHILLDCACWVAPRKKWLKPMLAILGQEVVDKGHGALTPHLARKEVVIRLLGGHFFKGHTSDVLYENTVEMAQTEVLDLLASGWGGRPDMYAPGLGVHGYIPVAMFLAAVMPKHKACLFPEGKGSTDTIAYRTTSEEDSPVQAVLRNPVPFDLWVEDGDEYLYRKPEGGELLQSGYNSDYQAEARMSMATRHSPRMRRTHALYFSDLSDCQSDASANSGTDF